MRNYMQAQRDEIVAADAAYRAGSGDAQQSLRGHLEETGGTEADGTMASLAAMGAWFLSQLEVHDRNTADDRVPSWWDPKVPLAGASATPEAPFTAQQLRLIDEVQAYYAEVLMNEVPTAQWTIYKGHKKDWRNGKTVLQLKGRVQTYPLDIVYGAAISVVLLHKQVQATLLLDLAVEDVARARAR